MKVLKAEFVDKITPVIDKGTIKKVHITYNELEERVKASALWDNLQKLGFIILSRKKVETKKAFAERLQIKLMEGRETHTSQFAKGYQRALLDLLELILK